MRDARKKESKQQPNEESIIRSKQQHSYYTNLHTHTQYTHTHTQHTQATHTQTHTRNTHTQHTHIQATTTTTTTTTTTIKSCQHNTSAEITTDHKNDKRTCHTKSLQTSHLKIWLRINSRLAGPSPRKSPHFSTQGYRSSASDTSAMLKNSSNLSRR